MFGRNKNKAKIKVKTAKGGGPIRKLKFMGGTAAVIAVLKWLGADAYIPPDLMEPLAKVGVELAGFIVLAVGYFTNPGANDGVKVEE